MGTSSTKRKLVPNKISCVCSIHFKKTDFDKTSLCNVGIKEEAALSLFSSFPNYLQEREAFLMESDSNNSDNHEMDIKVEIKEEPVCPSKTLTQVKSEYEEIDIFHSETIFVTSHFIKQSHINSEICNKIEIKEEVHWPEDSPNEIKQEMEITCSADADLQNGIQIVSHIDKITGDDKAKQTFRLQIESEHICSTNSVENDHGCSTLDIAETCQEHSSGQPQIMKTLETNHVLDSSAKGSNVIQILETPYKCETCGKTFRYLSKLRRHTSSHGNQKSFLCEVCKRNFTLASYLEKHKLVHEGKSPYKCEICYKSFFHSSHLKRHKLIHEGKRPYSCEICKKCFMLASHLKQHSLIHEQKKSHTCEVCMKSFTLASHLKQHKYLHEGKRPYTCEICHKGFTQASHMKLHKLTHEGKKPYACEICQKTFSQASHLRPHKLTHEGKKPYTCEICHKSFTQASNLKKHKLTHEGKKTV